jgi:hypothetical protein
LDGTVASWPGAVVVGIGWVDVDDAPRVAVVGVTMPGATADPLGTADPPADPGEVGVGAAGGSVVAETGEVVEGDGTDPQMLA